MRHVLPGLVLVVCLVGACSKKDSPTAPTSAADLPTTFAFTSDPASSVGQGESPTYTLANATFQVGTDASFISVAVLPTGATEAVWRFVLHPPRGQVLAPGRFPIAGTGSTTAEHGVEFSGRGRICSAGSGTLTINSVHNAGGLVDRLNVNFSLTCGVTPAVNGRIVLNWVEGVGYR